MPVRSKQDWELNRTRMSLPILPVLVSCGLYVELPVAVQKPQAPLTFPYVLALTRTKGRAVL